MPAAKGTNPPARGRGRPKGSPNKVSADVKAMVLQALDKAGGVKYLLAQSRDNPTAFMSLVGKVLPMTVAGDPESPLSVVTRIELVAASDHSKD